MARTPRKEGTYYDRTREERKKYQRDYYAARKWELSRAREVEKELYPERYAAKKAKAKAAYALHRERTLAKRRESYASTKNPES